MRDQDDMSVRVKCSGARNLLWLRPEAALCLCGHEKSVSTGERGVPPCGTLCSGHLGVEAAYREIAAWGGFRQFVLLRVLSCG